MTAQTLSITALTADELGQAYQGSYYTIAGAGGDLQEWITGYTEELKKRGIGSPLHWFKTTGADVNSFFLKSGAIPRPADLFQNDVTLLMFSLESIGVGGRLPLFRMEMGDRWFDDIIDNMKMRAR